jgi:putative ABC transport system permease protein
VNQPLLFRTVMWRFRRFKMKTIFMGLGITVAVLAVVLLQTALISIEKAFSDYINRAYPAESLVLMAGSGFMGGPGGRSNLQLSDVETVVSSLGVKEWDPVVMSGARDVKHEGNSTVVSIAGYSEQAETVRRRSVQEGEFFSADEVRSRANVALIGSTTAKTLFPGESPVGARLFIDNIPFEVKGVLETIGVDPHGGDQDLVLWVPYTTLMEKILKVSYISGATLLLEDPSRGEAAKNEIVDIVRERHQIGEGQDDDFSVVTPVFVRQFRARSAKTWNVFVRLIAGTAFLISAIVILSIMQISIKGRTAEIGLRKAVGARSRDLQTQIVLEVLLVSLVASVIGIVLAYIGSALVTPMLTAKYGVTEVRPPVLVMLLGVSLAILTGLVGGLWPARRAAKLNPVKALK